MSTPPEPTISRTPKASLPKDCLAESHQTIKTAHGKVTVRVRRWPALDTVDGDDRPVGGCRIEVAVNAPKTDGFRVVDGHYLDGRWRQPADDLAVHIVFGARVADEVERETDRRAAADRAPVRPRRVPRPQMPSAPGKDEPADRPYATPLPPATTSGEGTSPASVPRRVGLRPAGRFSSRGQALHAVVGACGIPSAEHKAFASRVLGRRVTSYGALTADEGARVRAEAEAQR